MTFLHFFQRPAVLAAAHTIIWFLISGQTIQTALTNMANSINTIVLAVGGIIFFIAVAVAGIMRMVAFGSERRIALSNMALTAAVVGLLIMLLATPLSDFVRGATNGTNGGSGGKQGNP